MTFGMLATWILGGLLAAGVVGLVLKHGGYGRMTDILLALGGAFAGSLIFRALGISPDVGLFGMVVLAFGGAAAAMVLQRTLWPTVA